MKYLLFYELASDGLAKVPDHFPGHRDRLQEYHGAGTLLMAGPYGDPPLGALALFTSREAAESFVAGDPFVLNGVVGRHSIHAWSEALAP
jgi:uncharacterized protein YciI